MQDNDLLSVAEKAFKVIDREEIQRRAQVAVARKRANGEYYGGAIPYGWAVNCGTLIEIPKQQLIIRLIHRMWAEGKCINEITNYLNKNGVPSKRGKMWRKESVKRIITRSTATELRARALRDKKEAKA